jgi:hypothetical protein
MMDFHAQFTYRKGFLGDLFFIIPNHALLVWIN